MLRFAYDYLLTINTPDGIDTVKDAIITMDLWLNPTVTFTLLVNGSSCNNPEYEVHTTYASAGEGTLFFDCSNIITSEGTYNVSIIPSKDTGASTFWVDLTYTNHPSGIIEVHGTEYYPGFNATTFLQLVDSENNFVNNGSCVMTIFYPSQLNNSKLFDDVPMTFVDRGIYELNFVAPDAIGVYKLSAFCIYENQEDVFELPNGTAFDGGLFDGSTGDPAEVEFSDCVFMKTESSTFQEFDFVGGGIGNLNTSVIDEIVLVWIGQNDKTINLQIFNFTSSTFVTLGASTSFSTGTSGNCQQSHGVSRLTENDFDDYIGGASTNEIHVRVLGDSSGKLLTDNIEIRIRTEGTAVNDIRGGGEVVIVPQVWEDAYSTNRTITGSSSPLNVTTNTSAIVEAVWNYSGTISTNILNQFAAAIWNFTSRVLTEFNYPLQATYVWNNSDRNLTFVNVTDISQDVWNFSGRYTHGIIIP